MLLNLLPCIAQVDPVVGAVTGLSPFGCNVASCSRTDPFLSDDQFAAFTHLLHQFLLPAVLQPRLGAASAPYEPVVPTIESHSNRSRSPVEDGTIPSFSSDDSVSVFEGSASCLLPVAEPIRLPAVLLCLHRELVHSATPACHKNLSSKVLLAEWSFSPFRPFYVANAPSLSFFRFALPAF